MKKYLFYLMTLASFESYSQGHFPWENPLKIAESSDGINFQNNRIFQDSAGVPCIIRWKDDTLICAFQWFRQPQNSPTWDRVAVKFSYDNGISWTQPSPIIINGFPVNYQRPFDPALTVINDSIRIYFSSSDGMPMGGLDSTINTYSAISNDGVNYIFEPNARYDHPTNKVIDPSVIFFNGLWHYVSPIGAPQDGAFHCTGNDGVNFLLQNNFLSDFTHNWTGNYMINDTGELRFYGSGQRIWYNTSPDGNLWQGYTNTNLIGGDPGVIRTSISNYIAVYVGEPYTTGIQDQGNNTFDITICPNPFSDKLYVKSNSHLNFDYKIYSVTGILIDSGTITTNDFINTIKLKEGIFFLTIANHPTVKIIKQSN